MRKRAVPCGLVLAAFSTSVAAERPTHPMPEGTEVEVLISRRCAHVDAALTRPGATRQCQENAQAALTAVRRLAQDASIPDMVWLSCRQESGSMQSAYFELWAQCLKVAKAGCALETTFVGIGIFSEIQDGEFTVTQLFPDSPAAKAGIIPGDVLVEASGRSVAGQTHAQTSEQLKGPVGAPVSLVFRSLEGRRKEITVKRAEIRMPSNNTLATLSCTQMIQSGKWVYNRTVK